MNDRVDMRGDSVAVTFDDLLSRARAIVPTLKEKARQTELDRRVSDETTAMLKDLQLSRLMQPKRFGGLEYGFSELVKLNFEVARGCGSTAWCLCLANTHNWLLGLFPEEVQQEVWADPAAMVSGSYMPVGKCQKVEGGYRLSGSWSFASNCDNSSWYIVGAMVPPEAEGAPPVPTWFVLPRQDTRIEDSWYSAGLAGTGSKTIVVDEAVFVPAYRALPLAVINSGQAPGTLVNKNPLYQLTFTGSAPFALSSLPVGMAMGAIEDFKAAARGKMAAQMGGPPVPMVELPFVQSALAEAAASVDAASLLLLRDAGEIDAAFEKAEMISVDQRIRHRRDHSYAGKLAERAGSALFEVMGANGGALSNPVQRAWRDISVAVRHISLAWPNVGPMYGQYALGLKPKGSY